MDLRNIENSIEFSEKGITKKVIIDDHQALCFVLNVKAGQEVPAHKHENCALVFTTLRGKGEVQVNDEISEVQNGSTGLAKGSDKFGIKNVKEDLSLFITISPKPNNTEYSKELV